MAFLSEILKLPKDSQLGQDDLAKDERFLVVDRVEPVARHHFRAKLLPEQCHRLIRGGGGGGQAWTMRGKVRETTLH
jgi:hypothetical protein